MTDKTYIDKFLPIAQQVHDKYGVPIAVSLVQSFLESGAAESKLAKYHNNYFGITAGSSWKGNTVTFRDWYPDPKTGKQIYYDAIFRSYPDILTGWLDYGNLLKNGKYYKDAFNHVDDPVKFVSALVDDNGPKYGTDPKYLQKFAAALERLKQYIPAQLPAPVIAGSSGNILSVILMVGAAAFFFKR